ncbi:putative hydrolase YcgS [Parapedobacter defluvii]|uniref:Hydrolase YcgS n=1 Tax=Parapedobacter defluvii TaxID=2045106 RepID=A0ABQ1MPE0_9SPHI|nr:alpha/beta hydrolase [Parapedobacter defluvii]GGC42456.1 putative hydrolase YcgS [Parapedobacter defluvii]
MNHLARQYFETDKGTVEYTRYGSGQPVLFFHGGHSNAIDRLYHLGFDPSKYELITPSRPGYGKTSLQHNESAAATATLMAALLDGLSIHRVILYAASAGGPSAIAFAAKNNDRVQKLILASSVTTTWLGQKDRKYRLAKRLFRPPIQSVAWLFVRFMASDAPMLLGRLFFREFSTQSRHLISRPEAFRLAAALSVYDSGRGFLNDLKQEVDQESLTRVDCPTLILHSKYDASVAVQHARHAKEYIPHAQLVLLENPWGHMIWIDDCRIEVEKQIQKFLIN